MSLIDVSPNGESRALSITGDPGAKLKVAVTENPRISPESYSVDIVKEFIATIDVNGGFKLIIDLPASTLATSYRVILTELISGTFVGGLIGSPITIHLNQWPLQQTKLEIIETSDTTWVLPAASVTNAFYYFSGKRGTTSHKQAFSFSCTHTADISADGTFTAADFTQVTGQSSTLTDTTLDSVVSYNELSYVIDNTVSPNTVVITGEITIVHGFDAGGHTYITLNINDILNHA